MLAKKIKRCVAIILLLLIFSFSSAFAGEEIVASKEFSFTTTNADYENMTEQDLAAYGIEIPKRIEGRVVLHDLSFELLSEKVPLSEEVEITDLLEEKVPKTKKLSDGKKYELLSVEYEKTPRKAAEGTTTVTGSAAQPDFAESKPLKTTVSGKEITVEGDLVSFQKQGGSSKQSWSATAKFYGDADVRAYNLGNVSIPNNPAAPVYKGYEDALLSALGYDPGIYTITGSAWTSDYMTDDNGNTVRYATYFGTYQVPATSWTAYYRETLSDASPYRYIYTAHAVYGTDFDPEYTVKVIANYYVRPFTVIEKVMIAGGSLLAFGLLVAIILMILKRKRNQEEEEEGTEVTV